MPKNYGYIEKGIEVLTELLGKKKLPFIYYQEDSSWREHLPKYENQTTKLGEETSGCTIWTWENALEIFEKGVYGIEPNYSERFIYLILYKAGLIKPNKGTNPANTENAILENGLIDDSALPMTRTLAEFVDTDDLTKSLLAKGQNWLSKNELLIETLWDESNALKRRPANYIEILKENLKRCPIPVSVSAWNEVNGVYVSDKGSVNNHKCVLIEIIDYNGYRDCPVIFDTYDHSVKVLHPEHNIRRAVAFWLNKKTPRAMRKHISILQVILNKLMNKQTLLEVCNAALGTDASPNDTAPDELGCVDTMTTLMRKVRPATPHLLSTIQLDAWLANPANGYRRVEFMDENIEDGDLIISPTEGTVTGHVGIFMEDNTIASNNSFGINKGKFTKNYTFQTWDKYYTQTRGLSIHVYRYVV